MKIGLTWRARSRSRQDLGHFNQGGRADVRAIGVAEGDQLEAPEKILVADGLPVRAGQQVTRLMARTSSPGLAWAGFPRPGRRGRWPAAGGLRGERARASGTLRSVGQGGEYLAAGPGRRLNGFEAAHQVALLQGEVVRRMVGRLEESRALAGHRLLQQARARIPGFSSAGRQCGRRSRRRRNPSGRRSHTDS